MNKTDKNELASDLNQRFSKAQLAVFADYKGLTSVQADNLRRQLRAHKVEVKVLKNNIGRLITREGQMGDQAKSVMDSLVGPTMVAFAYGDIAAAAKTIHQFAKDNEALKIKDSLMGKVKVTPANVAELANLPSREVLIAQLLGAMNGPIRNFVGVLAAVPRSFVTVLAAIEKKKSEA